MTNKLLTSVAAGALFLGAAIAPVAFAQDTTQPSTTQTMEDPAATPEAGSTDMGATPSDDAAATDTTTETAPATDTAETPADDAAPATDTAETPAADADKSMDTAAAAGDTYLTEQAQDQISANTYIGQAVYNSADESIGNIAYLIVKKEGGVDAAVIGVGGFLGIGEKWVAVPFENITVNQVPESGEVKLTTTETAESLEAAPEFKTLSQQMAEQNAAAPVDGGTTSSTGTGGMTPAPAE